MESLEVFKCPKCEKEYFSKKAFASHKGKCGKVCLNQYSKAKLLGLEKPSLSEESRRKISKANTGEKNPSKRKEVRAKISSKMSGKNNPACREDVRAKISESMKRAHQENRAGTFPTRKNCEHSWPERWLIGVLEKEFGFIENKDYETEFYFHKQFLDFAWPKRKLCIEVDGEQHKRFQDRVEADKRKNENLKKEGWRLLRLDWSYVCNNTQESVKQILDFLR